MKHLITTDNGGFPFDLDDIRWFESGFNEDIAAILKAWQYTAQPGQAGTPPSFSFIIFGCVLSGDSTAGYTWTSGAVFINGVIYQVDANPTPLTHTGLQLLYFNPAIVTDPSGNENFQDGVPHDTYGIRKAVVAAEGTGANKLNFHPTNTPRFLGGLSHVSKSYRIVGSGGGNPAYESNFDSGLDPMGFRKNEMGQVEFKGKVVRLDTSGNTLIFTLPAGFHPLYEINFIIHDIDNITAAPNQIKVETDGDVRILGPISATAVYDFGSIRFPTT